jgi:3-oxoacyl-[acyl-carrier protein] reductase
VDGAYVMQPVRQWARVIEVNLTGPFHVARAVVQKMLEREVRDGVLVNVSSLARSGNVGQGCYAASKAGLDAATRSWALELAPAGIRVASVAPGVIQTPMLGEISEHALEHLKRTVPLGRIGRPEEVWLAVRFAIECDFFTGRTLEVDGGAAMGVA